MDKSLNNNQKLIIQSIKDSIDSSGIGTYELFLFGSSANNNYTEDSDIDLLIVSEKNLIYNEKLNLKTNIYETLHKKKIFIYPIDMIIKSKKEYDLEKGFIGMLSHTVSQEGIAL